MMIEKKTCRTITWLSLCLIVFQACEKNDIDFGTSQADTYSHLQQVDTVGVNMSTFFLDSFVTTKPPGFLFGRYKDPELGSISARPFLELSLPSDLSMESDAVYDSISLVIKSAKYYYGDTSKAQTIEVRELAAPLEYTYNDNFYNTSSIAEKPVLLGSQNLFIRPNKDDSVIIKLDDSKGLDLFNKLKQQADQVLNQTNFINYFKGISISVSGNDSAAIYGITDSVCLRVHYHKTTPYHVALSKDFLWNSDGLYFNQLLSDRSGTPLAVLLSGGGKKEIAAAALNNKGYTQDATGIQLKLTFPTIKNILLDNPYVAVLKATLLLRIVPDSYDNTRLKLPERLYLATTNGTNETGTQVRLADGEISYGYPIIDNIYNSPPYYSFDITTYINTELSSAAAIDDGLFVLQNLPGDNKFLNRAVFSSTGTATTAPQLILTVLNIKN